jgi:peptide/nickel transport system substrate-binding protein
VCILDPVTLQGPDGVNKPVGTGPFAFGDYAQGDHLRMVRNANYWQSGQPHLDELLVNFAQDPVAMVTQLEANSLDVVVGPNVQDVVRLQKDSHYQVIEAQNTGRGWIMMANTTVTPLDNKLVRQALNFAVDRQRMLDTVLAGIGQPMQLPWGQSSIGFDAAKNTNIYPFDLDKARSLLANAGVSNFSLDLVFSVTTPAAFAQILQGDLAKIGVTASLKQLEPAAWTQQAINISYQGLLLSNILQTNLGMGTQVTGPFFAPDTNSAGFRDPQYSALAKAVMTETDPAKQKDEAAQFTDYVMDQSFVYPICSSPPTAICTNNVSGVNSNMHDTIWFGQASLSA